jgi:hypothetical protein
MKTRTARFGGPLRLLQALATPCAFTVLLDRWARYSAKGAEHAAIPRQWLKPHSAAGAVVEELAGIRWHRFGRLALAVRAG